MKAYRLITAFLLMIPFIGCTGQTTGKEAVTADHNSDKIEAYYFHFTARCTTCRTVEARAKEDLESLYPNQVKQGLITFQSLNLEEAPNKTLADKLGVSGQTLITGKRRSED